MNYKKYSGYTLSILLIFFIWLLISIIYDNSATVPTPDIVLKCLGNLFLDSKTYLSIGLSLFRLLIALIIAGLLGITLGILASLFKTVEHFLYPFVTIFRTIPIASIIIIIFIILNNSVAVYIITFLMLFPIIYQAVLEGIRIIEKEEYISVYKLDSKTTIYVIFKVYLPLLFPYLMLSLIQSVGLGFKVLVMGEYLCSNSNLFKYSIGGSLYNAKASYDYVAVYAYTIIIIVLVLLIEFMIKKIRKRIERKI